MLHLANAQSVHLFMMAFTDKQAARIVANIKTVGWLYPSIDTLKIGSDYTLLLLIIASFL